jgi:hypothetical protein
VPTAPVAGGEPGFGGYFLVRAEGRADTLLTFHPPPVADFEDATPLGAAGQFEQVAGLSGVALEPGRAHAVLRSVDCKGGPGAEVVFAIDGADELARVYYAVDGAPSAAADETDEAGNAFAVNLPPGYAALRSSLDDGDNEFELARFGVLSRPGFLTIASVAPDR